MLAKVFTARDKEPRLIYIVTSHYKSNYCVEYILSCRNRSHFQHKNCYFQINNNNNYIYIYISYNEMFTLLMNEILYKTIIHILTIIIEILILIIIGGK